MGLYEKAIDVLRVSDTSSELYRFQGGYSLDHFDIRTSRFQPDSRDSYIYFSGGIYHHQYFTIRRIRQMINKEILEGTPLELSCRSLTNPEEYHAIRNMVINTDKLSDLYSVKLITDRNFGSLIKEHCVPQEEKRGTKPIERVDRRVFGGGYGVAAEWKDLLSALTLFSGTQKINREDILRILANMRKTGRVNKKDNIDFLVSDDGIYSFEISPSLESPFTKYKIREALDKIVTNGNCKETSDLATNPTKTMNKIVEEYESNKSKILRVFDNYHRL